MEVSMNFLSLRYFLAVCQEMNITHAAKKLYMTQQSLSEHISRLEREYNVKLFERTPQFRLTYAGEQLMHLAEEALSLNNQIESEMADIADQKRGALSIGLRPTYSRLLLPKILPVFHEQHPYISMNFTIAHSSEIIPKLLNGQLDLVISSGRNISNPKLESTHLLEDYHCMIIPENILIDYFHMTGEELRNGKELDYSLLASIPLFLTEPGKATRIASDRFLTQHGVTHPNILVETSDFETNFFTCSTGMGITFSFYRYYKHFISSYSSRYPLYAVPINAPNGAPSTVILRCKDRYFSNASKEFINACLLAVQDL